MYSYIIMLQKNIIKRIVPDMDDYNRKIFKHSNFFKLYYKKNLSVSDKKILSEAKDFYFKRGKKK